MRQTLFRIPLDGPWSLGPLGDVPGFGVGIVLLVWVLGGILWFGLALRQKRIGWELIGPLAVWAIVAFVIVQIPSWTQRSVDQQILVLNRTLSEQSELTDVYVQRGMLWAEKREFGRAVDDIRQAVNLAPQDVDGHVHLAWLRATCPNSEYRDAAEAQKHGRIACDLTQDSDPPALDALAAAYAEGGDFERAVAWEQQAARRAFASNRPNDRARLGDIRKRLGQFRERHAFRNRYGHFVPVFGYGFMLFLGFITAGTLGARRAEREGLGAQLVWDLAIWLFVAGIVGARLFYLIQKPELVYAGAQSWGDYLVATINLRAGGLVFYGSLLGGWAAYLVFCWRHHVNPLQLSDILVPAIFIGLAFGRLGCLMNGCCFGDASLLPWKVTFPLGSVPDMVLVHRGLVLPDALTSLALHPTQIYSSLNGLVLALVTALYFPRRRYEGAVTVLGLIAYSTTRFVLEILRGDEPGQFETSLTISQWISLGVVLFALGLAYWCWHRPGKPATSGA